MFYDRALKSSQSNWNDLNHLAQGKKTDQYMKMIEFSRRFDDVVVQYIPWDQLVFRLTTFQPHFHTISTLKGKHLRFFHYFPPIFWYCRKLIHQQFLFFVEKIFRKGNILFSRRSFFSFIWFCPWRADFVLQSRIVGRLHITYVEWHHG